MTKFPFTEDIYRTMRIKTTNSIIRLMIPIMMAMIFLTITISTAQAQAPFSCDQVTQISSEQCEALVAFYHSTNGPNWTNNQDWLVSTTPCSWHGVRCSVNQVTRLELIANRLDGDLPPEIENLTNLYWLQLSGNRLRTIPPELGNLSDLTYMGLAHNQLQDDLPPELGKLTNLRVLQLFNNQLKGTIPTEWGNLINLKILQINDNALSGYLPPELGQLSQLTTLYLSANQFSGPIPSEFVDLNQLQFLLIGDTNICKPTTSAMQTWLAQLTQFINNQQPCTSEDEIGRHAISGQIVDTQGQPISGVTISISNMVGNQSTVSNLTGYYTFTQLITGSYTLTPSRLNYSFSPTGRTTEKKGFSN